MSYKIVNKKVFSLFVTFLIAVIGALLFGVYFFTSKIIAQKKFKEAKTTVEKVAENVKPSEQVQNINPGEEQGGVQNQPTNEASDEQKNEKNIVTAYENQNYRYGVQFPDKWYMNNDDSESKFEKTDDGGGNKLMAGGQTYWSNYADINKYTPKNKPDDFHLLSLTVYKDNSKDIDEFAKKIGAKEFSTQQSIDAINVSGIQYISGSEDAKNFSITAIFKNNDLFYVFRPAFINGDDMAADAMEKIVKSFKTL